MKMRNLAWISWVSFLVHLYTLLTITSTPRFSISCSGLKCRLSDEFVKPIFATGIGVTRLKWFGELFKNQDPHISVYNLALSKNSFNPDCTQLVPDPTTLPLHRNKSFPENSYLSIASHPCSSSIPSDSWLKSELWIWIYSYSHSEFQDSQRMEKMSQYTLPTNIFESAKPALQLSPIFPNLVPKTRQSQLY